MRKLVRSKDLAWLKLEAYAEVPALGLVGWHNALSLRYLLRAYVKDGDLPEQIRQIACSVLVNPLGGGGADRLSKKLLFDKYPNVISDMNVLDVVEGLNFESPKMRGIAEQYARWKGWIDNSSGDDEEPEQLWPDLRKPADEVLGEIRGRPETSRRIWVDVAAPDELILKSFSKWLKKSREAMGLRRAQLVVDKSELQRWTNLRVLPFIDMEIFARLAGREVTAAVAGSVLFPLEEVDSAERIRKVVKPLSERLMSSVFLEALGRQASLSRPERESTV